MEHANELAGATAQKLLNQVYFHREFSVSVRNAAELDFFLG